MALYKLVTDKHDTNDHLENQWIWGAPGVGKSRHVREKWPNLYSKVPNKWWDGYQGEETVLLDDLQKSHACLSYYIKIWADHYPFSGEIKGSYVSLRPKRIIVTSNYHPSDIWTDDPTLLEAITRRFKIIHMHEPGKFPPILRPNPFAKDALDKKF